MITQSYYTSVIAAQNPSSDETLVLACRRGDADAWSALVNRYQRLIYTIPRRAGLDEDLAAEVFQRTFARLLENLNWIRQPERVHAWLVTTARRETLQLIREQHVERSFSQADDLHNGLVSEAIPDDDPLPIETLECLEEQQLIRMAIAAMDQRSRDLLTLLYYYPDPLSYAEIAAILDIPEGSVGPTRARCLEKLRRILEQRGF
ncbi:MAG TPA: sigma-70 family RNA polymerase sigma factor [Anaerolineales bacterium]|nr:sigma-70 family RNA polymerase sigma factor [Anaerolineales bacterium]